MEIVMLDALTLGSDADLSIFEQLGAFKAYATTTDAQRIEHIKDAHIVLTNKVVIDQVVMDACSTIKLICVTATGMNNVDSAYAKQKGIAVKNVAGYSSASVAQTTLMLALNLMGKCAYYDQYVKSGAWVSSPIFTHLDRSFCEIKGKRWGIIGLGNIGKEVAKIVSAFGAEVVYFSTSGANNDSTYIRVSLEEMLRSSHIISIHAPLNDKTINLIGSAELNQMKPGVVLVNVGRGGILDEVALAQIIDEKELFVGLDVLAIEPMQTQHPLLHVKHPERLLLTPHIAWGSIEARRELIRLAGINIQEFLKNEGALNGKRT